ncbi:PhoX family protein [Nocardioides sp. B-3]|nr:PhoX family protein [Nocardioides sp. B-3]UUZ60550.1 PhoX family protein [Nocardioides sp. B-3]
MSTDQSLERRTILKTAAAASLAGPFAGLVAAGPASAKPTTPTVALFPVPDERDGVIRLHVPEGFRYRSFHDTTSPVVLTDGTTLPGRHDGMGAFPGPDGTVLLVRNHEVNNPVPAAFGPGTPYDSRAGGGTTTIRVTPRGEVIRSFTSLNGTMMNCSGGEMPRGSRVTCEETINGPDVGPDFTGTSNVPLTKPHGFVFEVPASAFPGEGQSSRQPIRSAGRFAHEAVSYDPESGYLYLTEDDFGFASGFYRYQPPTDPMVVGRLEDGGTLEMLKIVGVDNAHLEAAQVQGATYQTEWVPIADPAPDFPYTPGETAPTTNNTAITHVARQGWARGAAYFSRLEGRVSRAGVVYFTSTQGGGAAETGNENPAGYGRGSGRVGLRNGVRHAPLRLPVLWPAGARPAGQHHHVAPRHARRLRGQHRQQLHPRPVRGGQALQHRPEPDQRRVRRIDLQPGRTDALREHPSQSRTHLRHLGTLARDRGLSSSARPVPVEGHHLLERRSVLPVDRPHPDGAGGRVPDRVDRLVVGQVRNLRHTLSSEHSRQRGTQRRTQRLAALGRAAATAVVERRVRLDRGVVEQRAEVLVEVAVVGHVHPRRARADPRVVVEDAGDVAGRAAEAAGHHVVRHGVIAVLPPVSKRAIACWWA